MISGAVFSADRKYRYVLSRVLTPQFGQPARVIAFIGLNPSTASEEKNDPTIRREIGFAKLWGYSGFVKMNLFALVTTDPRVLCSVEDSIGPDNDQWLLEWSQKADLVVAAWGNWGALRGRSDAVRKLLKFKDLWCLDVTAQGQPGHPLYLPGRTEKRLLQEATKE